MAHSLSSGPTQQTLSILAKNLKLSLLKELSFALALTRSSQPDWRRLAEHHFKQKTNELIDKLAASNDINYKVSHAVYRQPGKVTALRSLSVECEVFFFLRVH